jgi:HEAT repeat protein
VPVLLGLLEDKDARVRAAAIRGLAQHVDVSAVRKAAVTLEEDETWQVRLGAYELMTRAPAKEAIPFLAQAAAREEGEIAVALDDYLFQLTGYSYRDAPRTWRRWYEKHAGAIAKGTFERFEEEPKAGEKTVASFFTIPIESERLVFAIDISGSMTEEDLKPRDAVTKGLMRQHGLAANRMGVAQAEAIRAVTGLPDDALFNIVAYSDYAKAMSRKLREATPNTKKYAVRWIKQLRTGDLTNFYDGLATCFGDPLARAGGAGRFDRMPDTIIFLTDGIPSRGRLTGQQALLDATLLWNEVADVAVHTVGLGKEHDRELLKKLAESNHGYYVDIVKGQRHPKQRRRMIEGWEPPVAQSVLDGLTAGLEHADWDRRVEAAREVAALGTRGWRLVPALIPLLEDGDEDVQDAASDALVAIGAKSIQPLIKALAGTNPTRAAYAAQVLAKFGEEARDAIPALMTALSSEDWEVPKRAVRALGAIARADDADVIEALTKLREEAIEAHLRGEIHDALELIRARK